MSHQKLLSLYKHRTNETIHEVQRIEPTRYAVTTNGNREIITVSELKRTYKLIKVARNNPFQQIPRGLNGRT